MRKLLWRRMGLLLALVVLLSLVLVPAASAAPASAPVAAPSGGWAGTCFHLVARGENLTRIAWRYGTTVWALMQWNGLANANRIYAGQTLRVCAPAPRPAPRPAPMPAPVIIVQCNCGAQPCQAPCQAQPCQSPCQPAPCAAPTAGPWNAEYFNNQDLSGSPTFTRQDSAINFGWGWGSPSASRSAPIVSQCVGPAV